MVHSDSATEVHLLSVSEWLVTLLVLSIPLVNVVMLFVWGFGGGAHPTRRNFARATLILYGILFGIMLIFVALGLFAGTASGIWT